MILFYDTETTHRIPSKALIVQLAASLCTPDGREAMSLNAIVYRPDPIPEETVAIHGITTEISQSIGISEGVVLSMFEEMLNVAQVVVAHNENYDKQVVTNAVRRLDNKPAAEPFAGKRVFDTMKLATPICKIPGSRGFKWPTLQEAHTIICGAPFDSAHDAMVDVQACRRVFFRIQEMARDSGAKVA